MDTILGAGRSLLGESRSLIEEERSEVFFCVEIEAKSWASPLHDISAETCSSAWTSAKTTLDKRVSEIANFSTSAKTILDKMVSESASFNLAPTQTHY